MNRKKGCDKAHGATNNFSDAADLVKSILDLTAMVMLDNELEGSRKGCSPYAAIGLALEKVIEMESLHETVWNEYKKLARQPETVTSAAA